MDLLRATAGAIDSVTPRIPASIKISKGYDTAPDGVQKPLYQAPVNVRAEVQALSYKDLQHIAGLNLNGTRRAIYLEGKFDGTVRVSQKGGDLITIASGPSKGIWLTALVLEQWADWCKVAATLQDGS